LPIGTLVSVGDTVLVSQHNPAMSDIGESLTNSLDRTGKGGMLADLPMNGNKVTGLAPGVNPTDAATVSQLTSGTSTPIGAVIDFWGTTLPAGFLLCAGQEVSRSTYATLFAVIGTAAGEGNGTTTFNLPDYRGRTGAGKDDMGGAAAGRLTNAASGVTGSTLGATGGAQTVTLTQAQVPAHAHTFDATTSTSGAHTHGYITGTSVPFFGGSSNGIDLTNATTDSSGNHSHSVSGTTSTSGSGGAHSNVQPTVVCNKIIRAS
jgi:microcystin-dependent protein